MARHPAATSTSPPSCRCSRPKLASLGARAFADEAELYTAAGLAYVEPELREGLGEVGAAMRGALPNLIEYSDIRGALHCHTLYSDGRMTIADMVRGARTRGWSYLGITDHSAAAFYAGGLPREKVRQQFGEIDELNATLTDFRVLKGIEADILADGTLDYGDALLDEFDFVVSSARRFSMDGRNDRPRPRALDDPSASSAIHRSHSPSRDACAIDLDAVLQKARRTASPWAQLRPEALGLGSSSHPFELGVTIAIGPTRIP